MADNQKLFLRSNFRQAMETIMENEELATANTPASQYKKPYLPDQDYPTMEWEMSFPGRQPWQPKFMPSYADCTVAGAAIGGGAIFPCVPGLNCGVWDFSCAHRITKFSVVQAHGWIQSVDYFPNDTVRVTVCWDDSARSSGQTVGPQAYDTNGTTSVVATKELKCVGPGAECADCTACKAGSKVPTISYTSQQMSCSGTQNLSATGGGGGPYQWLITAGTGSLSKASTAPGQATVYTAPATNANCTNNPTIQVTDYCGGKATLKIAINCYTPSSSNAYVVKYHTSSTCNHVIKWDRYTCVNAKNLTYSCDSCNCAVTCGGTGDTCCCLPCTDEHCDGFVCTYENVLARCNAASSCGAFTTCDDGITDVRGALTALGCCPAGLIS
jgi:hypothetical protein